MTRLPPEPPGPEVTLRIGVDQAFLDGAAATGFAGRVLDITPDRAADERCSKSLIVAVGYQASTPAQVIAGSYLVEAVSPSGAVLEEVVHISGDEGSVEVRLAGEGGKLSDRPGFAWQILTGNVASAAAPVAQALRRRLELADEENKRHEERMKTLLGPRLGAVALPLAGFGLIVLALRWSGWTSIGLQSEGGWFASAVRDPVSWILLLVVVPVIAIVIKFLGEFEKADKVAASIGSKAFDPRKRSAEPRAAPGRAASAAEVHPEPPAVSAFLFTPPPGADSARQLDLAKQVAAGADDPSARLIPREVEDGYWQLSVVEDALPPAARTGTHGGRFLIARALDGSAHLVALPQPWEALDGSGPRPIDVLIGCSAAPVSTAVADPQLATLLGYLSSGQMTEARLLATEACALLRDKLINPYAAAAGAYALLSADDTDRRQPWREWVANLSEWFPQMPDGAVLQGWNLLQVGESDAAVSQARLCFLAAADRGIPVFAEGVRRLAHGLSMFAAEDPDGRVKKATEAIEQLAIRCRPQQPFTTLRLGTLA